MLEDSNTGISRVSKSNKGGIWNFFAGKFAHILSRKPEKEMVILPESVRYALRYRDTNFLPEDGLSLLLEKYGFLGVYICLKFYQNDPQKLLFHLQVIIQGIKNGENFAEYTQKLREDTALLSPDNTVLGTKSAQVSRNGFSEFCEGISTVFNNYKKEGIPILVAFSGLLGLKGIIQEMKTGESFYIFFPKNPPENAFLRISCEGTLISVSSLEESRIQDVFHNQNIIMIDDTEKTGATFDQAEQKIRKCCSPKSVSKKALVVVSKTKN